MDADFLVSNFKNWAVVGDVTNHDKYAYKIFKKFNDNNYNVVGVHPKLTDNGFNSLSNVPFKIDVIDLCINKFEGIKVVKEAKELGIKYILIQPGASSDEIVDFCNASGIIAVHGCALISLSKLIL